MLPPIEDSILQNNPKFALLHATLSQALLNPTGSTKHRFDDKERKAATENYSVLQVQATKSHILRTAVTDVDLTSKNNQLPSELLELIYILSLKLEALNLPPSSETLLESSPIFQHFPHYTPQIGALLSSHLQSHTLALSRLAHPSTNPSFQHRNIPKLPQTISNQIAALGSKKLELQAARQKQISSTIQLLRLHAQATELIIQHLERTVRGSIARSSKARIEHLSLTAAQTSLNIRATYLNALGTFYNPEVLEALRNYALHLKDGRSRLRQKGKDLKAELNGYGVGREGGGDLRKEKVMRELARIYGEVSQQLEDVRKDIERLRGR